MNNLISKFKSPFTSIPKRFFIWWRVSIHITNTSNLYEILGLQRTIISFIPSSVSYIQSKGCAEIRVKTAKRINQDSLSRGLEIKIKHKPLCNIVIAYSQNKKKVYRKYFSIVKWKVKCHPILQIIPYMAVSLNCQTIESMSLKKENR